MIRTVAQCGQCHKQADLPDYRSLRTPYEVPAGWLHVYQNGTEQTEGGLHFCSRKCLREWAERLDAAPDWENLTEVQRKATKILIDHISAHITTDIKLFEREYPDLHIGWNLIVEPYIADSSAFHEEARKRYEQRIKGEACCETPSPRAR